MTVQRLAPVAPQRPDTALDASSDTLLRAWLLDLRHAQGRSERTVVTYGGHVRRFFTWITATYPVLDLSEVRRQHVRAFLLFEAARGLAPPTRATALFAVRSFFAFVVSEELREDNPTEKVSVPGACSQRTFVYSDEEAHAICTWAHDQATARWGVGACILETFRYTGLRLAELCSLRIDDLDLGAKRLSVVGKGSKHRIVPIPPVLAPVLEVYLVEVRATLPDSPYVFANPKANAARQYHGRFAPCSVEDLVRQAGEGAGIGGPHFPHRWRHTYATSLLRRGVDIYKVKRLLGHSKLVTTERYLNDDDLADAVDKAFPEPS